MIIKNTRYYTWSDDDELIELKILKQKNEKEYSAEYTKGPNAGDKITITEDILSGYTKLAPDGIINFCVANLGQEHPIQDVMVFLTRTQDSKLGNNIPYCVCRQCVNDLFAKQLKQIKEKELFGISISQDSCPANVDFCNFLACNSVYYSDTVAFYIGDTLSDILKLVKTKNFDNTLYNLFSNRCKYVASNIKYIYNEKMKLDTINGYCKTLKDLLEINNFEYDIQTGFGIIPIDKDLSLYENNALDIDTLKILNELLCLNIKSTLVVKYDKSIDLKKIARNYQLVADKSGTVYVVAYTYSGKYEVPIDKTESAENIEKLNKVFSDSDIIRNAYNNVSFNRNKYEQ